MYSITAICSSIYVGFTLFIYSAKGGYYNNMNLQAGTNCVEILKIVGFTRKMILICM